VKAKNYYYEQGFTLLNTVLALMVMMTTLFCLESLFSFFLRAHQEWQQKRQVLLQAQALEAAVLSSLGEEKICPSSVRVVSAKEINAVGVQVIPAPFTPGIGITVYKHCAEREAAQKKCAERCEEKERIFFKTVHNAIAVQEHSGRSEVWFDGVADWEVLGSPSGVKWRFKLEGERAEHELWLSSSKGEHNKSSIPVFSIVIALFMLLTQMMTSMSAFPKKDRDTYFGLSKNQFRDFLAHQSQPSDGAL
jgi:hypothetical protein